MKKQPQGDSPWTIFEPLFLRRFIKKRMLPIPPRKAFQRRDRVALLYFACTVVAFHLFLYDKSKNFLSQPDSGMKAILKANVDDAKIIKIDFPTKTIKVIEYDRDDHQHLSKDEKKN